MNKKLAVKALIFFSTAIAVSGCGPTASNNQGIEFNTSQCQGDSRQLPSNVCLTSPTQPLPYIPVSGNEVPGGDYYNTGGDDLSIGSVTNFGYTISGAPAVTTDKNGNAFVSNGRAPASWNLYYLSPFDCGTNNYAGQANYDGATWDQYEFQNFAVHNYSPYGSVTYYTCYEYGALLPASTRFAILGSLPGTLTLGSAAPLTTTYGMPLLYVYDGTESVIATETATSVNSSGTEATFPFPSSLNQNGYSLALVNQTNTGPGFSAAGTNLLSIASSQTIPGNPFGVAAGGLSTTTSTINRQNLHLIGPITTTYNAFPIVSLYSSGQVLIGGVAVTVGANPTAVATYTGPSSTATKIVGGDETTTTISGTTRAVVVNSGGNSISILDTLHDTLVTTITVGNQPVALAVSSDGTTAYVANYADSTVSQVNLSTETQASTVAVGGQPTSVALTAGGILWVGGAGFLTEINTQTMTVVATQSTGRNVIALAYTDAYNELIATSSDAGGSVYVDEVNPTTVQTGAAYSPAASQAVSSLGSYVDPSSGTPVLGYTATLATRIARPPGIPISPVQLGAPPLVVQDGWAVVSATPTGFTISDASGNAVLISETTPSPVTGIAVDTNLNSAYLVMPDSNTLLTVPLPGTGTN